MGGQENWQAAVANVPSTVKRRADLHVADQNSG